MIASLLAHEFRRTRGLLAVVAGGVVLVVVAGSLAALTGWPWLASIGMIAGVCAAVGLLPLLGIALAVDYWRSAYGHTGYLTHSLPVKGSTIYGVRLLYGFLVSLAALLLTPLFAVLLLLAAASHEAGASGDPLRYVMDVAGQMLAGTDLRLILLGGAFVLFMSWGGLIMYYFAASIGSGPRLARLGAAGPVAVYVVLYLVLQVLTFVAIIAVPYGFQVEGGVGLVGVDWWAATAADQEVPAIPLGFAPAYALAALALVWWTARAWNKDLSLR